GGGIAGMTAALQISQAGLTPLVIVGPKPGGIITVSPGVENWPGDLSIAGAALADKLEEQLEQRGVKLLSEVVTSVDFSRRPFTIHVKNLLVPGSSSVIQAECCIIALGATPNQLQVPGESSLLYNKIFTCAPCDGLRFKDKTVAVVGGGESALIEAYYLANIAKQVIVIVRGKEFKTIQPALKEKLLSKPNVKVIFQTTVQKFQDDSSGVVLYLNSKETLLVQGVFLAIGSRPNTDILKNSLELDSNGYIILKEGQTTSITGVFAAGDVSDRTYKQAVTAAGDATKAALDAIHYISGPTTSPITEISDLATLKSTIQSSKKPVIAYFYAPSCMPCRSFKMLYQKWSQEYGSVARFLKINGERCPACFDAYKVQAIPAVLIIDFQGKVIQRAVGAVHMSDIVKFLEKQKKITDVP
ncbi:MAG: FAD-dependent oxidoreductase, partial [Rhabdochlamydiaceae bacterium]